VLVTLEHIRAECHAGDDGARVDLRAEALSFGHSPYDGDPIDVFVVALEQEAFADAGDETVIERLTAAPQPCGAQQSVEHAADELVS
jgi:hypothetical protein